MSRTFGETKNCKGCRYWSEMIPCKSSQIAAIGHDPETNTLAIQFPAKTGIGSVYHYQNFTAEDFAAFSAAESKGAHFGKHIKPLAEKFPFVKIKPVQPDNQPTTKEQTA